MVSSDTLMNDPDCEVSLTVQMDEYDEKLGVVISRIKKPIALLLSIIIKKHHEYTITRK